MEEINEVNRDTLAADVGTHIPDTEASFDEEETSDTREEETTQSTSRTNPYTGDSDEEGKVIIPNPTDVPDCWGASDVTIEHRFRESIRSFQRFICDHYRRDHCVNESIP